MTISVRSSLEDVAGIAARVRRNAGIDAVLTGGACATIYSGGEYQSFDLDFVLVEGADRKGLDAAMAVAGFRRAADRYVHPKSRFFVEFPRGLVSIGNDSSIVPTTLRTRRGSVKALSATDSCRDRLAAYFFWDDLSSLEAAVAIAVRNDVDLRTIAEWSSGEGHSPKFRRFEEEVVKRRRARSRRVSRTKR